MGETRAGNGRSTADTTGPFTGYAPGEDRPLGPYAFTTSLFGAGFAAALIAAERSGRPLPERIATRDIALVGVAAHKLSRLVTKERVTSFIRAPFVRYEQPAGRGEVVERARGTGLRRTVGELLNCPYCLGQWITGGFLVGLVAAPRPTRLVASTFAADALADFLQLAYSAAERRA